MHIYQGTIPDYDEGLARSADLGTLTHLAIARLAPRRQTPTLAEQTRVIADLLDGVRPIEKRAHRQNLRAAVMSYFSRLSLPDAWVFLGAETPMDGLRADLVWRHPEGQVLIDEVKTGHHWRLTTSRVRLQVHAYVTAGRARWGDAFLGCRLLSTYDPGSSTFTDTDLLSVPLTQTPYRK